MNHDTGPGDPNLIIMDQAIRQAPKCSDIEELLQLLYTQFIQSWNSSGGDANALNQRLKAILMECPAEKLEFRKTPTVSQVAKGGKRKEVPVKTTGASPKKSFASVAKGDIVEMEDESPESSSKKLSWGESSDTDDDTLFVIGGVRKMKLRSFVDTSIENVRNFDFIEIPTNLDATFPELYRFFVGASKLTKIRLIISDSVKMESGLFPLYPFVKVGGKEGAKDIPEHLLKCLRFCADIIDTFHAVKVFNGQATYSQGDKYVFSKLGRYVQVGLKVSDTVINQCLKVKDQTVEVESLLTAFYPSDSKVTKSIERAFDCLLYHLSRKSEVRETASTYYLSNSGLVDNCFPLNTKRRLKKKALEKVKSNSRYKISKDDYEDYKSRGRPKIDAVKISLSAKEKSAIHKINTYYSDPRNYSVPESLDQSFRLQQAKEAIKQSFSTVSKVNLYLGSRKGQLYSSILDEKRRKLSSATSEAERESIRDTKISGADWILAQTRLESEFEKQLVAILSKDFSDILTEVGLSANNVVITPLEEGEILD